MKKLNPKIISFLSKKLKLSENTVRKNISLTRSKHPKCTPNAAAQIYASKYRLSVLGKMDREDRLSSPNLETETVRVKTSKSRSYKNRKRPLPAFINYDTEDYFIKGHIEEVNRAYNGNGPCYTCANIFSRKIIENLIINVLRAKFPAKSRANKELYYDTSEGRHRDFGEILGNLYIKREAFGPDKKIVERLVQLSKKMKGDANDKTHSLFHIIKNKKELDDSDIQQIFELIKKLEKIVGLR